MSENTHINIFVTVINNIVHLKDIKHHTQTKEIRDVCI